MAQQTIDIGATGNDGTGDALRVWATKDNANFAELYAAIGGLGTASTKSTGIAAGNVPVLDGGGLLDPAILPAVAISDIFVVASQAAMLALTAQKGDVAIRTDLNKSFALSTNSPSTLADWKELLSPTAAVLSVAGLTGAISAAALVAALALPSRSGRLSYVSATAIKFAPFGGDLIKINGAVFQIPSGGIAGVANTSVYVNGVAGQNLAASTFYYVYAFNNAGTLTADFSTTAHATSATAGNVGTEIKSGDDTRTLIGMVRTNASSQFVDSSTQRFVRSWFNNTSVNLLNTIGTPTTTSTSLVEMNSSARIEALLWDGEKFDASVGGSFYGSFSGAGMYSGIGFDGTTAEPGGGGGSPPTNFDCNAACRAVKGGLSEGYHYATALFKTTSSNTLTVYNQVAMAITGTVGA